MRPPSTRGWRVESFHGVQVKVPPGWGWGSTPGKIEGGLSKCSNQAFAPGNGGRLSDVTIAHPVVSRPLALSDACAVAGGPGTPSVSAPHVWFDSPLAVGTDHPGQGWVRTTVQRGGVRVTVADRDPAQLAAILGTIKTVHTDDNGCASTLTTHRWKHGVAGPVPEHPRSLSICLYIRAQRAAHEPAHASRPLFYSTRVDGRAARAALRAIERSKTVRASKTLRCRQEPMIPQPRILLGFHGTSGGTGWMKVESKQCPGGIIGPRGLHRFTEHNVAGWSVDAVPLYASPGMVANLLTRYLHW